MVGVEGEGQEQEIVKSIRMYNLASLTNLAASFATQPDTQLLELSRPKDWSPQEPKRSLRKSHRYNSHGSITHGVRSFRATDAMAPHSPQGSLVTPPFPLTSPRSRSRSPNPSPIFPPRATPRHQDSASSTDSWDMVEDLPLRWATEYIPLATPNSRLANCSVLFFELWKSKSNDGRGTAMLAIATKTCILLYETPKRERAFRFVKVCRGLVCPVSCAYRQYRLFTSPTGILYSATCTKHQLCPSNSRRRRPQRPPPPRARHQAQPWIRFQRRSWKIEIPHS